MARVTAERVEQTKLQLLEAARLVLTAEGYAGLSTRRVAEAAGTQMSQIQYHFGSKEGMILALFERMNAELIARQKQTFENPELSLSQKWFLACDYLEEDITSGYVRVMQELIAAGWSNPKIGSSLKNATSQWQTLLADLARSAAEQHKTLGPFTAENIAVLVACAFLGAEALLLLGVERGDYDPHDALRRVGEMIEALETKQGEV